MDDNREKSRQISEASPFQIEAAVTEDTNTSVEKLFESTEVPPWQKQVTVRAMVVSAVLSFLFTFIVMKLNLTTGIIPSLNVSAGLLGFFFLKTWTKLLEKGGWLKQPFTRQENTVIQTCVVASSGIAFSGGAASYVLGMSSRIAKQGDPGFLLDTKNPALGWMIGFLFIVSFLGLFSVVPLRKIMIVDFKLSYPSGTATALLINSFHTPKGAELAKKQVKVLGNFFSFSFLWAFYQWFFTGSGDGCGFANFPTFGLTAFNQMFYFDFSATYVGVGMICPYITNVSLLLGSILSWGIMWPLIAKQKGHWYDASLSDSSFHGLQGYKIFIAIAIILGDGLYNFFKVFGYTIIGIYKQYRTRNTGAILPSSERPIPEQIPESFDDQRRTQYFLKDNIPYWAAVAGYVIIAVIAIITLPHMFHNLRWYYILVMYIVAPILAFCNAYGCGLTDWSLASSYGKLAIFIIGGWAGASHGGIVVGLAACGAMMNIVSTAADLTQDFKTGYLTLSSPRSMFISQIAGTLMGCFMSPCVFWIFYKAFPGVGIPGTQYPAPYASIYRNIALLGVQGLNSLPKHCLKLCIIFFVAAMLINFVRDMVDIKYSRFIPIPMAMAIPFFIGGYFAIDMCLGSLILFLWQYKDRENADAYAPAVASGLICGDGLWGLPSSLLALTGARPPICMKFVPRNQG
ncbi:probable metal-nicotianamine transporter YSL7 [Amaranthus tricolor]|uniref:probable metal-nicotianamine transporter YSL7 n=1 Tax=Amaranthus tricolor TaxID=29722 RepID=UPI0025909BDA|nr:probable metal-nicotianamine transporter YSL7 [Amaranthus tricolor]